MVLRTSNHALSTLTLSSEPPNQHPLIIRYKYLFTRYNEIGMSDSIWKQASSVSTRLRNNIVLAVYNLAYSVLSTFPLTSLIAGMGYPALPRFITDSRTTGMGNAALPRLSPTSALIDWTLP